MNENKMKSSSKNWNQRLEPEFSLPAPSGSGRSVNMSYCEFMQKNKPQSNSFAGGILILAAGGYHIAWLLWNFIYPLPTHNLVPVFFQFACWYIGIIIGNIVAAMLVTSLQKKNIYYLSGGISSLSSILFIIWFNQNPAITVGRLLAGCAHGMAYLTSITHGSENCVKEIRGRLISPIHFLIYSSAFCITVVMVFTQSTDFFPLERMIGILALFFALMGVAFTPCLTYESITYLLNRNNERKALENMIKLRNESVMTWNIKNDLEEMKLMVAEDRQKNRNIFADENWRPLTMMLAISFVSAASSNLILNRNLVRLSEKAFVDFYSLSPMILVGSRYIAGIVPILFGDLFGRKKILIISAGSSAICLFVTHVLGIVLENVSYDSGIHVLPAILAIGFQVFIGVGVEPIQHVLLSEAFSTSKKYWSIAFVVGFESCIQIALVLMNFINSHLFVDIFIFTSILCIALLTIVLQMKLPETRGMSLKQARDEFTKTRRPEGITYS